MTDGIRTITMTALPMTDGRQTLRSLLIGLILVVLTAAVYSPVRNYDFVDFDDNVTLRTHTANAEAGRFAEAVETARRGLDLATRTGNTKGAGEIRKRLQLYERDVPYHEESRNR